jgi:hypothetical protein
MKFVASGVHTEAGRFILAQTTSSTAHSSFLETPLLRRKGTWPCLSPDGHFAFSVFLLGLYF